MGAWPRGGHDLWAWPQEGMTFGAWPLGAWPWGVRPREGTVTGGAAIRGPGMGSPAPPGGRAPAAPPLHTCCASCSSSMRSRRIWASRSRSSLMTWRFHCSTATLSFSRSSSGSISATLAPASCCRTSYSMASSSRMCWGREGTRQSLPPPLGTAWGTPPWGHAATRPAHRGDCFHLDQLNDVLEAGSSPGVIISRTFPSTRCLTCSETLGTSRSAEFEARVG